MTAHCDERTLVFLREGRLAPASREQVEEHLAGCTRCRSSRMLLERLVTGLRDPGAWRDLEESGPSPALLASSFAKAARRRSAESEAARTRLRRIGEQGRIPLSDPEIRSAGGVQALIDEAQTALERQPRRALEHSGAATDLAEALAAADRASVPEALQAMAWKEKANALRFLGEHSAAMDALDRADSILENVRAGGLERAITAFARAMVFLQIDRAADALPLTRRAAATFLDFGDQRRYLHARTTEAAAIYNLGRYDEARLLFLELAPMAQEDGDVETLARLLQNAGTCEARLGLLSEASGHLVTSSAILKDLGRETESIRAKWILGRILLSGGEYEKALEQFDSTRSGFDRLGLRSDAALVGLDSIEALLALSRPDDVAALCRDLVRQFTSSGVTSGALTALSYLNEAAQAGKATPRTVAHVRTYLERLPREPALLFLPMPES